MNPRQTESLPSPARRAAFDILRRVESEGAYASNLIAALPQSDLSREDRALAQEIALGVLRWRRELDRFIERYSKRPLGKMDLPVLVALRMGIYQLRHMTRIPQSAAVNESVNLVKTVRVASAAAMVNGALRNAARHLDDSAAEGLEDPLERASVETSHPQWLLERWIQAFGDEEARRLAMSNNQPPRTAFRVNTLRSSIDEALAALESEGILVQPSEFAPGAFVVESGPASAIARMAERASIYIQDEASQLVPQLLAPKPGDRILDLCAAPGSKSSQIAAMTGGRAWVLACDIHSHRLANLFATCRRLGISSVDAIACDATGELPITPGCRFDRVLLDAPCSGTGTLRRNPEIKWRLTYADINRLAALQLELLTRAVDSAETGGRVVYSTCSVEPEENEQVIARFLSSGAPVRVIRPDAGADLTTNDGFVRTFPHRHCTDGFFAAVLEKTN